MLIKSQLEVCLHTGCSVYFHPGDLPDPPFRFFMGLAGSKTTTQRPGRAHSVNPQIFFSQELCLHLLESCGFVIIWVVEYHLLPTTVL